MISRRPGAAAGCVPAQNERRVRSETGRWQSRSRLKPDGGRVGGIETPVQFRAGDFGAIPAISRAHATRSQKQSQNKAALAARQNLISCRRHAPLFRQAGSWARHRNESRVLAPPSIVRDGPLAALAGLAAGQGLMLDCQERGFTRRTRYLFDWVQVGNQTENVPAHPQRAADFLLAALRHGIVRPTRVRTE